MASNSDIAHGYCEATVDPICQSVEDAVAAIERELGHKFDREAEIVITRAMTALVVHTEWRSGRRRRDD